ncbi:G/U mismatch-specific DNA glycosylase [soil metagenome]
MKRIIPVKKELLASKDKTIGDIIKHELKVLFCGINPGLFSAYSGFHFGRPGNRFWKALYMGGFTDRLFNPSEQQELVDYGYGITNMVDRATLSAAELTLQEYTTGGIKLREKIKKYKPEWCAFVGIEAYRKAFNKPHAIVGKQPEPIGDTNIWVLPSPSGLNAHYTPIMLAEVFAELKAVID